MGGGDGYRYQGRGGGRGPPGGRGRGRGRGRPEVDTSIDLPHVLYSKKPFRTDNEHYEMSRFVRTALECDVTTMNEFLLRLGNDDNVLDKLRQVIASRFNVRDRTFQDIALPLLRLLTSRTFLGAIHTKDIKNVFRVLLGEPLFFRRVRNCIESETDVLAQNGVLEPSVSAFASTLNAMVRKVPDCATDDDVYHIVKGFAAWVELCDYDIDLRTAVTALDETLEMCVELVPSRRQAQSSARVTNYLVEGIRRVGIRSQPVEPSVGGFDQGPRHDNDNADFRSIDVIPTDLEMRCVEPPHLPTQLPVGAPMERHLDFHFRLLREDVLAQIRRGVQWAFHPQTLATCLRTDNWSPPREANVPMLNVSRGVRLEELKGSIYKGVMLHISALQPAIKNKTKANLRAFWDREDRFKQGSLVCIGLNVAPGTVSNFEDDHVFPRYAQLGAQELIFATVAEANREILSSNVDRFSISLKLLETHQAPSLVTKLTNEANLNLLIEVRGLFFTAYEPILRSLQRLDQRGISSELQQCLFGDNEEQQAAWQQKPEYARRIGSYNLQFLARTDTEVWADLSSVPVKNFSQLVRHLKAYEQRGLLVLDASQVEAFAAAMTQQVCLIQGPPGTGKSYVGTKIVKGILAQTGRSVGPILCVCYTNHALDQFLEGLVEEGMQLSDIVRVGSRSKSEVLEGRSLNVLKRVSSHSSQESKRFNTLFSQCRTIEETYLDGFVKSATASVSFFNWVRLNQPVEYAEIVGTDSDDGFQHQGNRARDLRRRWEAWQRGETWPTQQSRGLWALPVQDRTLLVSEWEEAWRESTRESIGIHLHTYNEHAAEAEQVNNARALRLLQSCKVVGMTTTGCAIHQSLIRALAPKIVVCEEAGEVLEAHLLACLSEATEQLIQIGDHMQLRPILNEYDLSHDAQGSLYNLDVSMFERLVNQRSDVSAGSATVPGSLVTLHTQRRMRPEICDLIRLTLYPQLENGPQVLEYPDTRGFTHNLWFFDHDEPEDSGALSHSNAFEAEFVVELVAYAIKQGYGMDEITILTPYLGQLLSIRKRLMAKNFRFALDKKDIEAIRIAGMNDSEDSSDSEDENDKKQNQEVMVSPDQVVVKSMKDCVRLSTVDNFQGNESHLVFISNVRSNNAGNTGFLKTFNRVNVMLSRAKSAMYILGSALTVRRSRKAKMFNTVLDILEDRGMMGRTIGLCCQKHDTVVQVASPRELRERSPDGGCRVNCDQRLRCGHTCPKLCHSDDPRHVAAMGMEPCIKRVAVCGHLCKARCHEACRCSEIIPEHKLACGHTLKNVKCADVHRRGSNLRCPVKVEVELPFCHHSREISCAQARDLRQSIRNEDWSTAWAINLGCDEACGVTRTNGCDHKCQHKCGQCMASSLVRINATKQDMMVAARRERHSKDCIHPCERVLLCGHTCKSFCHPADQCPPCEQACASMCSHSKCSLKCKEVCASCSEPCIWSCVHQKRCELPCGSPCTRLPCDLRCPKRLKDCGHQCPGLCGEPCLSSAFCRECPRNVCTQADDVVDLMMFSTVLAHNPDESPLVRLRCGHCFTVETLDGLLSIGDYYEQDRTGTWVGVKPLQAPTSDTKPKVCPTCRAPIGGVHRYARMINFQHLHQSELKYLQSAMSAIAESKALRTQKTTSIGQINQKLTRFTKLLATDTPTQEMSTKEMSRLASLGMGSNSVNLNLFRSIMQSQAVLLLGLESLALTVEKINKLKVGPGDRGVRTILQAYQEGIKRETKVLELATRSQSHRSRHEATVLGLELRAAYVLNGRVDTQARESILREMDRAKQRLLTCEPRAPVESIKRAETLCQLASGHLTKEEKDAIFRVFATGNDVFAQGFGGHWYQCPAGHPYVVTECGGPMQRASCPECGAAIGGESHRLESTNTTAASFFT